MTAGPSMKRRLTAKTAIWLAVTAGLLLVLGANAHLLYVAVTSQPDCVAHLKPGDGGQQAGYFAAAQSDCTAQRPGDAGQASEGGKS
jgi:hypothetical protein